ncbi:MAG: Ig-like domain-containing protein, partial [Bacteroidota bacterium]|nr:Ig-like domain-containing protein [Bacteroidota bacterium]
MNLKRFILFSCMSPILLVTLGVSVLASQQAYSQTADEVIGKYVDAMGGKDKLLSIQSIYQEGVAVMQNGTEIDTKTWKVQGKLYRQEINFGMGSVVNIVTPTQGWSSNPRNGGAFAAMTDEQVKNQQIQLDCAGPLVNYAAKGYKAQLLGKDIAGKTVTFFATAATLSATQAVTNANGVATVQLSVDPDKTGSIRVAAFYSNTVSSTTIQVVKNSPTPVIQP